jgi:hypothetical protein
MANWQDVAKKEGLSLSADKPADKVTDKSVSTPSWQDVMAQEAKPAQSARPAAPRMSATDTVKDVVKGTFELPAAIVTSGIGTVAGDIAGGLSAANNYGRKLVGAAPNTDPMAVRNTVADALTYKPTSQSGQASLEGFQTLMTPIAKVAKFAGDVSGALGGDEITQAITTDVAGALIPGGVIKGAPVVARGARAVGEGVSKAASKTSDVVGKVYTPETQLAASAYHFGAGDPIGGALQAGWALKRMKNRAAAEAVDSAKPTASVAEFVSDRPPGITTKAEGVAIKDIIAERRAANAARLAAQGRVIGSTVGNK